ncbi:MAG TPA: serine/threonine-protein kinase [Candidatus Baltobacteraceae bacterium]|jgi:serine/threonine protein kinase|nr:serine/threonine-protein kinase [Candidatus Baltobacteraceae bacterium]
MSEQPDNPTDVEREIFLDSLECASSEQLAIFLDRACAGKPAIRRAVERLLKHHKEDEFMQPPGLKMAPLSALEKPGDRIGRYKLLQQIGEGGCGVVYLAEQEEPVRREIAIKVIKLGMDTKSVISRFEAERQALALMDHPNIAKIFDAGATETGRPYFVMELVRGVKITDYCDQNNVPVEQRLELFIQVCQAIQHAHQKGIIHRDIKPSNILVTLRDGVPVPKVIDFGIAKATTEQRLTDRTLFTAFQQFIGTPAYMSPEHAEMSNLGVDTRSDIYSLGVLLYELLSGQTPFDSKTLVGAGLDELRRIIREEEPVRPSTRLSTMPDAELTLIATSRKVEPPKLIHSVRGDLDWIVMKALEKDRTRRYETASGLAADIQRHLKNEPVVARPPSNLYKFQKFVRRNKLAFAAAALIVVVLVTATAISVWQAALARQRLVESESISKFLTEVFQSPDPARDARTITVAEALAAAARKLEVDLADQPARRVKLEGTLARTYHSLGLDREAIPLQEKVLDYLRATSGPEDPDTLMAMHRLALFYDGIGRREEALELQEEVLALRRKVLGPENPDTLWAMNNLSFSYENAGRNEEALKLREEALALRRKVNGPEDPDTLWAMNSLAFSYDHAGRFAESVKLREEASASYRKVRGPENPDTLTAMVCLASSYEKVGRRQEALELLEEVLAIRRRVSGPEHPDTLWVMYDLAISYDEAGRRDEALKLREEVLALRRKVLGPQHYNTLWAMHALANSYDEAGRRDEALKLREEVLAFRQRINGPTHPDTVAAIGNLATSYDEAGRRAEALKMREQVLDLDRKEYGPEHPQTLEAMDGLAISYEEVGREEEALKLRELMLSLRRKVLGPDHPDTIEAMDEVAISYGSAGRDSDATSILKEAYDIEPKDAGNGLTLAVWQAWLDQGADYEATCRRLIQQAEGTDQALTADYAAKACCLRPSTNAALLSKALNLAQRAVELGGTNSWLPYYRLGLGSAEYRNGQYAEAERNLILVEQTIREPEMLGTARFFRAMSLFRQNEPEKARRLFEQTEAQMVPLPQDERKPHADGEQVNNPLLILWLAYKEAKTLVADPSHSSPK